MTRNVLLVVLIALLISTLANGRYIADTKLRLKRQTGDLRTAELRAWLALAGDSPGCNEVACGLVDVEQRSKRQTGDLKAAAYQAWLALGRTLPTDCPEIACGVVDVEASTFKRTSSDQRIAELQALIALSNTIGHGQVNPEEMFREVRLGSVRLSYANARVLTSRMVPDDNFDTVMRPVIDAAPYQNCRLVQIGSSTLGRLRRTAERSRVEHHENWVRIDISAIKFALISACFPGVYPPRSVSIDCQGPLLFGLSSLTAS